MSQEQKTTIRNSTAEFLIFTGQAGEDGIEVRVAEETVWLTQKLMGVLFEVSLPTINEHLSNLFSQNEISKTATIRNFRIVQKMDFICASGKKTKGGRHRPAMLYHYDAKRYVKFAKENLF